MRKYTLGLKGLPFRPDSKQVIYVENEYDEEVNRYIQDNYDRIVQTFRDLGHEFCYLPYLARELASSPSVRYYAPFSSGDFKPAADVKSDFILNWMLHPEDRESIEPSLLYCLPCSTQRGYTGEVSLCHGFPIKGSGRGATFDLSRLLDYIRIELFYYARKEIKFSRALNEEAAAFYESLPEELKERVRQLEAIAKELRQAGVKDAMLDYFTHGQPKVAPMRITSDYRIVVGGHEVGLTAPKSLSLYLLYLNHAEGIAYKDLEYCTDELKEIYRLVKRRDVLTGSMAGSIERMARSGTELSWHLKFIRSEFEALFEERLSRSYTIEGVQGEARAVALPRSMVSWECVMPRPTIIPRVAGRHEPVRDDFG